MRLNLAHWPPLASHLTCLLAGVALAHLSWTSEDPPCRLPARSIVLTMPPNSLRVGVIEEMKTGSKVLLVRKNQNRRSASDEACHLDGTSATVLYSSPQLSVALSLEAAAKVPELLRLLRQKRLSLQPRDRVWPPACAKSPRITYGMATGR